MNSLFTSVLEISWQAGLIALAVMAVRPLLRRAPRRAVCMLWLLVALRLLLPARLTVESPVSLQQPESPPIQAYQELRQQEKVYVSAPPEQRLEMAGPAAAQGFALLDQLPAIWLTGVGCMALYMALSLLRMRWRLRAAPRIQDNVYRCTDWSTPFVLGVIALVQKFMGIALGGFTTVIILLLFIGSLVMISLGIIGYYVGNIYEEIQDRPRYIIAEACGEDTV